MADDYAGEVQLIAINANDAATYADDAPQNMAEEKRRRGYAFPYLFDAQQSVARDDTADCTPDFFLFATDRRLFYRGQMDDTRPRRIESGVYDFELDRATAADLRAAIDA